MNTLAALGARGIDRCVRRERAGTVPNGAENLRLLDLSLHVTAWLLLVVSSVQSLGLAGPVAFLAINSILVWRRPQHGLMVLLTILYTPALAFGLSRVFAVSVCVTAALWTVRWPLSAVRSAADAIQSPTTVAAIAFVLLAGVGLVVAPDLGLGFRYAQGYLESLIFFILAAALLRTANFDSISSWWVVVAAGATLIRLLHLHLGPSTPLYEAAVLVNQSDATIAQRLSVFVDSSFAQRLLWPGEEPNYTAAGLLFPFSLALSKVASPGPRRLWWLIAVLLLSAGILGTFSRSGAICAGLILVCYLALLKNRAWMPTLILLSAVAFGLSQVPELVGRLGAIGDSLTREGATGRFDLWALAVDLWSAAPLFGNGTAAYYATFRDAAHNSYLQVAAELGLVGLIAYCLVPILAARNALANWRNRSQKSEIPRLIGLIALSVMIATLTFQDVKLFWLACAACSLPQSIRRAKPT